MDRGLKFRIKGIEVMYYLCSGNKGAEQLRSYCAAGLRFFFRICKNQVISRRDVIHKFRVTVHVGNKVITVVESSYEINV